MKLQYQVINAFADRAFAGNPAAVCVVDDWLPDALMQGIAAEFNLSETAFVCKQGSQWHIRWFTPTVEIDLCGHATVAAAQALYNRGVDVTAFRYGGGTLLVHKQGDGVQLTVPAWPGTRVASPLPGFAEGSQTRDCLIELEDERAVRDFSPDLPLIAEHVDACLIITAKGDSVDFVCRVFGPNVGIDEDPVTGSAFCSLVPYWSEKLGKLNMHAAQISQRGGQIRCTYKPQDQLVEVSGPCATVIDGTITI